MFVRVTLPIALLEANAVVFVTNYTLICIATFCAHFHSAMSYVRFHITRILLFDLRTNQRTNPITRKNNTQLFLWPEVSIVITPMTCLITNVRWASWATSCKRSKISSWSRTLQLPSCADRMRRGIALATKKGWHLMGYHFLFIHYTKFIRMCILSMQ